MPSYTVESLDVLQHVSTLRRSSSESTMVTFQ
jgi:hypothetical protein